MRYHLFVFLIGMMLVGPAHAICAQRSDKSLKGNVEQCLSTISRYPGIEEANRMIPGLTIFMQAPPSGAGLVITVDSRKYFINANEMADCSVFDSSRAIRATVNYGCCDVGGGTGNGGDVLCGLGLSAYLTDIEIE